MTWLKCIITASVIVTLGGLLQACAVDPATSSQDARITANVKEAIAQQPDLGPPNQIDVDTRKGVVYLSGIVDNGLVTEDAKAVALRVAGVTRVDSTVSIDR